MSEPAHDAAGAGPGLSRLLDPPVAAALNHLLAGASWARTRLQPFAGRTARFKLAPFAATLAILDSGDVADAPGDGVADVCFTLTPVVALRVLAADQNAWQAVQFTGDASLARAVLGIAQNMRWDFEEDLTRLFGDIAAHRMAQAAREISHWQREAVHGYAHSAAVYWTEERPLIAMRQDIERYLRDVDALRDAVARAEKRLEILARRRRARASGQFPGNS